MVDQIDCGSVLILGDGNFSFATAFCRRLETLKRRKVNELVNLLATVRESKVELVQRYPKCGKHVEWLEQNGINLCYGIDATRLDGLQDENGPFDHIIFNFPHVGGKTNLRKSRQLLLDVFLACKNIIRVDGRFYLTLARGQSGLDSPTSSSDQDSLPTHIMDSWQPLYLSAFGQFIAEDQKPFLSSEWTEYGYDCTGYKNSARKFRVENGETLIFRRAISFASPETLEIVQDESVNQLHPLRPFFVHDIAFWIANSFDSDLFVETVRRLSKGLVKRIVPLPQYRCEEDSGQTKRVSLCFRFVWQAANYALSRPAARDLQLFLRDRLPDELQHRYGINIVIR